MPGQRPAAGWHCPPVAPVCLLKAVVVGDVDVIDLPGALVVGQVFPLDQVVHVPLLVEAATQRTGGGSSGHRVVRGRAWPLAGQRTALWDESGKGCQGSGSREVQGALAEVTQLGVGAGGVHCEGQKQSKGQRRHKPASSILQRQAPMDFAFFAVWFFLLVFETRSMLASNSPQSSCLSLSSPYPTVFPNLKNPKA